MPERSASVRDSTADRALVTSRLIHAPRERVFEAFADASQLALWWGPKGFTNTFHEFDFRPGGHWRFTMHGPDRGNYANESVFAEIAPSERVVVRHVSSPRFELTITFPPQGKSTMVASRQA